MAVMVWCQSCNTVVWAYNHQEYVDLRGICNMLRLPCPKCEKVGNFDGWGKRKDVDYVSAFPEAYDDWSLMRLVAERNGIECWEPSPDNTWFSRPSPIEIT